MILSCHPSAPNRPYLSWQRKVRMQLEELLKINNPDSRTRGEIMALKGRIYRGMKGLLDATKRCSSYRIKGGEKQYCPRRLSLNDPHKQCAFCRERKRRYERHRKYGYTMREAGVS